MSHSSLHILGRSKPSPTALIVLLVVAALLSAILRMILPWAQPALLQNLDSAVWVDYAGPYDLAAAVAAASASVTLLLRR